MTSVQQQLLTSLALANECMPELSLELSKDVSSMRLAAIQNVADAFAHPQTCVHPVFKVQSASFDASNLSEASLFMPAEANVVATLPSFGNLPAAFEDCIELGLCIFQGLTPEERKAGTCHSAQLLHKPGQQTSV